MKRVPPWKVGARRIARFAKLRAESERRLVTPERLATVIDEYVESRAFAFWARLAADAEGLTETVMKVVEERCPGFSCYAEAYRKKHPRERDFLWTRISCWFDDHVFAYAEKEGWNNALAYYGARDPRMDRIGSFWSDCNRLVISTGRFDVPSFEEWLRIALSRDRNEDLFVKD